MMAAVRRFSTAAAQLSFLKEVNEFEELTSLLLELGRAFEAVSAMVVASSMAADQRRIELLQKALKTAEEHGDAKGAAVAAVCLANTHAERP